ncbi:hypothetical protein [Persephonella sp.]|uniref:hypothetical protein n=1 Tax=Persephonella sp. TaxID=2060922 RepID=UPI0026052CF2|nr:hypothetical protein [Persephonella sp.]
MKIDSYDINLSAQSKNINFSYEKLSLRFITTQNNNQQKGLLITKFKMDITHINLSQGDKTPEELMAELIKLLIEKITGKKIKNVSISKMKNFLETKPLDILQSAVELDYKKVSYKENYVKFIASGYVKTKDGRQIKFDLSFEIDKSQLQLEHLNLKAGSLALIDPLVIVLDGDISALLSDGRFEFDIDSDGKNEKIPLLKEGKGFLVFDKNENGKIDNGGELFGTKTGDGFGELSDYDEDKNNWIDENDRIFNKLGVWMKTPSQDRIYSLKDLDIGAIYLGNTQTYFPFKNSQLSQSGIYLKENLDIGFISKIDFKV